MALRAPGKLLTAYDLMDGMRAAAALLVLISHMRTVLFLDGPSKLSIVWKAFYFVTGFGHQAVMVFFVLSGYWITKTVTRRSAEGGFTWPDYAIDRLSRLWIVLVPALLIGGLFDAIGRYGLGAPLYLGVQGTNTLTWDVGARLSLTTLMGNLAFLQLLVVPPFGSNGPLWSLANEFWYYVWFPPLFHLLRARRFRPLELLLLAVTMLAFKGLIPGFGCWLFGSLLFFVTQSPTVRPAPRAGLAAAGLFFAAVLCLSRIPQLALAIDGRLLDLAVSGSFALLLFVLIRCERSYSRLFAPLCRFGARSSYSLYVVHFPLVALLTALFVAPVHRFPPSAGLLLSFAAIGSAAIVFGYGVSMFTEANTAKLRRWLKGRCLIAATV